LRHLLITSSDSEALETLFVQFKLVGELLFEVDPKLIGKLK